MFVSDQNSQKEQEYHNVIYTILAHLDDLELFFFWGLFLSLHLTNSRLQFTPFLVRCHV